MYYTAILFATDAGGSGETLTCSRTVDTDDKKKILALLLKESELTKDSVDTILLVRNGKSRVPGVSPPEVFRHWTARGGDFE